MTIKTILIAFFSLVISIQSIAQKDFSGAEIQSKETFHFGRFETRFYSSNISGMLSTFFLFENDGWRPEFLWQEIDVEVFGKDDAQTWQSNPIYEINPAGPRILDSETHGGNGFQADDWHVFTVDWTPNYIEWFVDDVSVRRYTNPEGVMVIGAKPMLAIFNHWSSNIPSFTGPFDPNDLPSYQFVDYIRIFDWIEGEEFESDPSFEDNFDNGLSNWNLSNFTFAENISDFTPLNVDTQEGYLILAFTRRGDLSIEDKVDLNLSTAFPNPTTGILHLNENSDWQLLSLYGTPLAQGSSNEINLTTYDSGIYFLTLSNGNTIRIIKE